MSQAHANKVARMLSGKQLRYTVRILRKDGTEVEFQAGSTPKLDYNTEARRMVLECRAAADDYDTRYPVANWADVQAVTCEENPGWNDPAPAKP